MEDGARSEQVDRQPVSYSRLVVWSGVLGLALASLLVQFLVVDRSFVPMDEGHLVATAHRLLMGDLLYRDAHTGMFPGIYYLAAALFEIFGPDVIVTRWAQLVVNTLIAVCLWWIGLRLMRPRWAVFAPILFIAVIPVSFPVLTMLNYSTVSLFFGLAALLFMLRYLERADRFDAIGAGVALAFCAITKQNFGFLVGLALFVGFLFTRLDSPLRKRSAIAGLLPVVVSGACVTLVVAAYFLATGTFSDLFNATFTQLLSTQTESYYHPIPPILGPHPENDGLFTFLYSPPALFSYLVRGEPILGTPIAPWFRETAIRLTYGVPMAALLVAPFVLWVTRRTDRVDERRSSRVVVVFACIFFPGIFPSAIWSHLAFVLAPVLLVLAWIGDRAERGLAGQSQPVARAWWAFGAVVVLLLVFSGLRIPDDIRRWNNVQLGLPRASLYLNPNLAALYQGGARFLGECADPGEPVFVAPALPLLYFVTDRPNPTRYDLTIPGDVHGDRIIKGLSESQTRCVIYDPVMYFQFPPFEELFPEVSEFLGSEYVTVRVIRGEGAEWHALKRRDLPGL